MSLLTRIRRTPAWWIPVGLLVVVAVAILVLAVFFAVYLWITPYREIALIREGNIAAAVTLAGTGGRLQSIGQQKPLQGNACRPDRFERADVFPLQVVEISLGFHDARIGGQHLAVFLVH